MSLMCNVIRGRVVSPCGRISSRFLKHSVDDRALALALPHPLNRVASTTSDSTIGKGDETSQPTPVGKAGFEVWVLTKGGLVSVHHCRLYRAVVHAHHVGGVTTNPRVRACIGMVRSPKANFPKLSFRISYGFTFYGMKGGAAGWSHTPTGTNQ